MLVECKRNEIVNFSHVAGFSEKEKFLESEWSGMSQVEEIKIYHIEVVGGMCWLKGKILCWWLFSRFSFRFFFLHPNPVHSSFRMSQRHYRHVNSICAKPREKKGENENKWWLHETSRD